MTIKWQTKTSTSPWAFNTQILWTLCHHNTTTFHHTMALHDLWISKVPVTISLIVSHLFCHSLHYVTFKSQKFWSLFSQFTLLCIPYFEIIIDLKVPLWILNLKFWVTSLHIISPPSIIFLWYFSLHPHFIHYNSSFAFLIHSYLHHIYFYFFLHHFLYLFFLYFLFSFSLFSFIICFIFIPSSSHIKH